MKVLLLFPPQWTPISPHFAIPSLMGQLLGAGYEPIAMDLNIDFYNKILDENYIKNSIIKAIDAQQSLLDEISKYHSLEADFSSYPIQIQNKMVRYAKVKGYITQKNDALINVPRFVQNALETIKDKEKFYNPESMIKSLNIIDTALDLASLPYYPSKISFENYYNPFFKLNFESIKYYVFDKDTNIYLEYYKSIIDKILENDAPYIGISINSSSQIIPGLTLAHMLKEHSNAHINIGGNFFGRVKEALLNKKEFFDLFCHSVLVEEGEKPVVELAQCVDEKISIEEVSNLIYVQNDIVKINPTKKPIKLDEMHSMVLDGFDFSKYFAPEIILPFQSSRGCYWGKCSFCDQDFGQNFNVKNVDKLVNEFIEMKEKYGITNFEFIDESVSSTYMSDLANKLKEKNLDIKYFCDARLENTFSCEVLKKAYDSGLKMILWGLESGSDDVMEKINKGIDIEKRLDILKNSSDSGIWNFAFIFFGFPTETKEDAQKTINYICANTDVIHSYGRSVFTMGKHTKLRDAPESYGITAVYPAVDEFSPSYAFDCIGMTKEQLTEMTKLCTNTCNAAYNRPLWMYLRYREFLFLYLAKYNVKWLSEYKLKL